MSPFPIPHSPFPIRSLRILALITITLTTISCDLFTKPKDPDFLKKIDEEISWANAQRLSVNVAFPPEWGVSTQSGENRCFDAKRTNERPRAGYPFNVEFTPNSGFGFIAWLAFEFTEDLRLDAIKDLEFQDAENLALKAEAVKISPPAESLTGAYVSSVTVVSGKTITLVPFCSERPYITQSNPPLINSGFSYTRGQEIRIWMNLGYAQDTEIEFGEDLVTIYGQNISNGLPWGETGDLKAYYEKPVYEETSKSIVIKPNSTPPQEDNYPPGNCTITVTVGTGIKSANGKGMAAPVSFSYRTSNEIVSRAYKANNVWAIHDPENTPRVGSFFYQTAPEDRDRRLRNNYEITLYFSVSRSMGEIEDPEPDSLSIAEIYYADLGGVESKNSENGMGEWIRDDGEYTFEVMENTANSAGSLYRQMNSGYNPLGVYYYKAVYTFNTDEDNGIYRLVVLPWRSEGNPKEQAKVGPDEWDAAVAEGCFVTVVMNKDPPGGSGTLNFSGYNFMEKSSSAYIYTADNRVLGFSPNFSGIRGNGTEGGILLSQATPNLPWTMEEQRDIEWQWQVINSSKQALHTSDWLSMGSYPAQLDVSTILREAADNNSAEPCTINVRFRNTLGYVSALEMGKIKYGIPSVDGSPVYNWSVEYGETGTLNIKWTTPANMQGVEVMLYDEVIEDWVKLADITGTGAQSYTNFYDFDLPSGRGTATEYLFDLIAYSGLTTDAPLDEPIKIWNYPGMINSEANPIIEIADENDLIAIGGISGLSAANANKQYVLTDDITLNTTWTPIGSGSGINAFQGKFYGNGKTITLPSGFTFKSGQYYGIFGVIENALIRDLKVLYNSNISHAFTNAYYLGGIAGSVDGDSSLIDCEVSGGTLVCRSSSNSVRVGGIAGRLQGNSQVINCISAINISATTTASSGYNLYAGGIVGSTSNPSTQYRVSIQNSGYTGSLVSASSTSGDNNIYAGGLLGDASYLTIQKCYSTGEVKAENRGNYLYVGGLAGQLREGSLLQSWASGDVTLTRPMGTVPSGISAGGLIATTMGANTIHNCYSRGDVKVDVNINGAAGKYAGGLIGFPSSSTQIMVGFSTGSVENKQNGENGSMYAGGIVGNGNNVTVSSLVALGSPITAQKSNNSNLFAYRIGYTTSSRFNNNYALDTIQVGRSELGYDGAITWRTPGSDAAGQDGAAVNDATRRTAVFWTGTMGFDPAVWDTADTAGISSRGYPILLGVGGQ